MEFWVIWEEVELWELENDEEMDGCIWVDTKLGEEKEWDD
jgi:hypothetical protein